METTIVMLSYNNLKRTKDCIESMQNHLGPETNLIVIDDGSTDGSAQYISSLHNNLKDIPIRTIALPRNMGASVCRNKGIQQSQGRYILFLDNDTILLGDVPKAMIDIMKRTSASICGMCGVFTTDYTNYIHIHSDDISRDIQVDAVPSYCMMVDRQVIDEGVLFDEEMRHFGAEDVDFCFHARSLGHTVLAGANIPLMHYEHGSSLSLHPGYVEWMDANHLRVKHKWSGLLPAGNINTVFELIHQGDKIVLTTETQNCKFFDIEKNRA